MLLCLWRPTEICTIPLICDLVLGIMKYLLLKIILLEETP